MKYKSFLQENFFLFRDIPEEKIDIILNFSGISIEEYHPGQIMLGSKTE